MHEINPCLRARPVCATQGAKEIGFPVYSCITFQEGVNNAVSALKYQPDRYLPRPGKTLPRQIFLKP